MLSWRGGIGHPKGRIWPQASPLGSLWGHPACVPPLIWHRVWCSMPEGSGSVGLGMGHRPHPPHPLTTTASASIAASHSHPHLERLQLHQRQGAPEDLVPPPSPPCGAGEPHGEPSHVPTLVLRSSTGGWDPSLPGKPAWRLQGGPEFGHQSSALVCWCPCKDSSGPPAAAPGGQARTGMPPPPRGPASGGIKLPTWL